MVLETQRAQHYPPYCKREKATKAGSCSIFNNCSRHGCPSQEDRQGQEGQGRAAAKGEALPMLFLRHADLSESSAYLGSVTEMHVQVPIRHACITHDAWRR
jgi:hypothetical protein